MTTEVTTRPARRQCSERLHGALSTWHRKAEIELFGARCEIEHVYSKNERIAVEAVAAVLKEKAFASRLNRA